jgi:hypothetical protein
MADVDLEISAGQSTDRTIGPVDAVVNYMARTRDKPHTYNYEPPAGTPRQNFDDDPRLVTISDIRYHEALFDLDRHGFSALRHTSPESNFTSEAAILGSYYPESEALLVQHLQADRALIFDHTIRRRRPDQPSDREGARQPVSRVHVDQTPAAARARVRRHVPDEADRLLAGRVRIVNLWRPLREPVVDHPLAMLDGGSVEPQDLAATDLLYPDRKGETYSVIYNPAHRWYYWSEMRADEVLLLKCYDSIEDGRARFSPHTAFPDPRTLPDAPPRESIELRALIFGG